MKKFFFLILIISISFGQAPEFSGYFEHQMMPQNIKGSWLVLDYNKLRLDLKSDISEKTTFNADFIWQTQHGVKSISIFNFIPEKAIEQILVVSGMSRDSLAALYAVHLDNRQFLDNAYVTFYLKQLNIRIGKQQLARGTGYAWNPTDIFHDKNILDPTYEKEGVNTAKVEWFFAAETKMEAVYSPQESFKKSGWMLNIRTHVADFDMSVLYGKKAQKESGEANLNFSDASHRILGADFSGQFLGLGIWAEGAWNMMKDHDDYGQIVVGSDYTFENGWYVMTELYYNGRGRWRSDDYSFSDWLLMLGSQGENLGRQYAYGGIKFPLSELLDLTVYSITNFNDKSELLLPWFNYSLSDESELSLAGYVPLGPSGSEFGAFGAGGFARLRIYF